MVNDDSPIEDDSKIYRMYKMQYGGVLTPDFLNQVQSRSAGDRCPITNLSLPVAGKVHPNLVLTQLAQKKLTIDDVREIQTESMQVVFERALQELVEEMESNPNKDSYEYFLRSGESNT